jgi:hypothetical protein
MIVLLAGSAVLACFGAPGVALLRRFVPALDPTESLIYGVPVGWAAGSLALLGLSCGLRWHAWLVVAVALAGAAVSAPALRGVRLPRPRGPALFAAIVLAALTLRWLLFWATALTLDEKGLWTSQLSLWGDAAQHLGDVASFAYGDNFPPLHPRFPGAPFNYHYLSSITSAALVAVGLTPWQALAFHSFIGSLFVALATYAFARKIGLTRSGAATALLLLVLGGGLGWWVRVTGHEITNLRWLNVYFALIAPQRGWLYGLPLGLLVLRMLQLRSFVAAGVVASLLPYAHLGTFLTLAMLTPVLALAFPSRRWLLFFGTWALLAAPQILIQQAGSAGAASALRWQPGWVAPPDSWLWFWLKNLGAFAPLLLASFWAATTLPPASRRFLLAFQPLFIASNLFVFQPWDWDNTKVLAWWYLGSCLLVVGLLEHLAQLRPAAVVRPVLALIVLSMVMSGVLENVQQARGRQRNLLLTSEEVELARRLRASTPAHALFAVGLQHNHPVPVLTGRRVLMGFRGWLWSQGIDYAARERDLRAIMTLGASAQELIAAHRVDYVVVGPGEKNDLGADVEAWRARYPSVLRTESYEVFSVAPNQEATTSTPAPRATAGSP